MSQRMTRCRRCALIAATTVGGYAATLSADTVSIAPAKDNTLFSGGVTSNGAGPSLFSGRTYVFANNRLQRAVMEFDVAAVVPAGATITGVTLTLWLERTGNDINETHSLHRLLAEWGEGTSAAGGGTGGPPTTGDATWVHTFYDTDFWATEGGDFAGAVSASQSVPPQDINPIPVTWGSTPQMVADVQLWLDDTDANHGWVLMGNEQDTQTSRRFASRDHGDPALRPALTIEFELPAPSCPGDVNEDGVVNVTDLLTVVHAFGSADAGSEDVDGDGAVTVSDLLLVITNMGPCPPPGSCPADLSGDGTVNVTDLLQVVGAFGTVGAVPEDLNGDGLVNVSDLLYVIRVFGPCP